MKNLLPDDYTKLTINNFFCIPPNNFNSGLNSCNSIGPYDCRAEYQRGTWQYNSSTGIFNVGQYRVRAGGPSEGTVWHYGDWTSGNYQKIICVYPLPN